MKTTIMENELSLDEQKILDELNAEFETKAARFQELESLDDIASKDNGNDDGSFKLNFEELNETGRIGENEYLFYDYTQRIYLAYSSKFEMFEEHDANGAKHFLVENFKKHGIKLKNSSNDLLNLKKVRTKFILESDKKFIEGPFGTYFNTFNVNKTKLLDIKNMRRQALLTDGFEFKDEVESMYELRKSCPYFYRLLQNLFESNDMYIANFINKLSYFVNERKKTRTATVFSGVQGSGKGVFFTFIGKIFGDCFVEMLADNLKSDFNKELKNMLIVNFNEFSSDFSKKDSTTQKLKSLITDDTFILNDKNTKTHIENNYFMTFLSQNDRNSIKISQDDRRFNYFIQDKTLTDVCVNELNITVSDFINLMNLELDNLCYNLAIYDYKEHKVNELIETEHKKNVQNATSNGIDILSRVVRDRDIKRIEDEIENQEDLFNNSDNKNKYNDQYKVFIGCKKLYLSDLKDEFAKDVISNKSLSFLYSFFVSNNDDKDDKTINKIYTQNFGDAFVKTINGKSVRVRPLKKRGDNNEEDRF